MRVYVRKSAKIVFLFLMMLSFAVFSNRIMITGQPFLLERAGQNYSLPKDYVVTTDYRYVLVDGKAFVCYLTERAALASLPVRIIDVEINSYQEQWRCYPYNTTYFEHF